MTEPDHSDQTLDLESLRTRLPDGPGVYLFKDGSGQVIYGGKAKSLRKRVLSYFRPASELPHKTAVMMDRARGLDYILTATDNEAFIVESSLIKKHMPRYNIILRDDKQYPCLRLDVEDPYPRLTIVRKIKKDGALYFGPFSSAHAVRSTLKLIDRIFLLRKCKGGGLPRRSRPCLNYQLMRCLGPCSGGVSSASYREGVGQATLFLEGRNKELIRHLNERMQAASVHLDFERAGRLRDQIRAVKRVIERQNVVTRTLADQDVVGLAPKNGLFQVVILHVRGGYLSGTREYLIKGKGGTASEVMEAFLKQYYEKEPFIPGCIVISHKIEDLTGIMAWLSELAGRKVSMECPSRGKKRYLLSMALANAETLISSHREPSEQDMAAAAKEVLGLGKAPRSIIGLDISNFSGDMAVGAAVSFVDGRPLKTGYRDYRIRGVEGINDYGMMAEMVSRHLSGGLKPDLFLVDGGKGHLAAVKRVVDRLCGPERVDVVSIAKADRKGVTDRIYIPGRKNPLSLRPDHPLLLFLMRIRDEAHRRAVSHHRRLMRKGIIGSELDAVHGIGPAKKRALVNYFGTIDAIRGAGVQDLASVPGISRSLAETLFLFFRSAQG